VFILIAVALIATTQQDLRCAATMQRALAVKDPATGQSLAKISPEFFAAQQFFLGRLTAEDPGRNWNSLLSTSAQALTESDEALLRGASGCILRAFSLSSGAEQPGASRAGK
jgi:hypothetical protein